MKASFLCIPLVLLIVFLSISVAGFQYTHEHQAIRALLLTNEHIETVQSWELDVWSRESALDIGWNDIVVNKSHFIALHKMQVEYTVLVEDVAEHIRKSHRESEEARDSAEAADFFTAYHTYSEISAFLQNISTTYSTIAKYIPSIGKSIEGRDIFGIVLTGTSSATKKKLFFSCGQHAREWIAPATCLYIIQNLATLYATNSAVKNIMDSTQFHFIPQANPDGYVYTWASSSNRLWRKNRRANTGGSYGVDLNRNWNDHWGGEGSSKTPTSDTYCGTAPFSEPETKALSDYVMANRPFAGVIDYHSYSQLVMRPYGWTTSPPPTEATLKAIGDTMAARILAVNNVAYTSQPGWQLYYTSGTSRDWYYSAAGIPLSFTIELRDTGTYGFQLPPAQIKPTGAENWAAFLYFAQSA